MYRIATKVERNTDALEPDQWVGDRRIAIWFLQDCYPRFDNKKLEIHYWNGSDHVCSLMIVTQGFIDNSFECCCVAMRDFSSDREYISKRSGDSIVNSEEKSRKKVESDRIVNQHFEPSMKTISHIMKVILEKNSLGRTALSQEAHINYATLSKHLKWLKNKSIIDYVIEDDKVCIRLTESGRKFALQLQELSI